MAVAMDIGWRSPSFPLGSGKKRGWGEDQQKLLQLMIGQPIDDGSSSRHATTLDLLGGSSSSSTSCEKEQQQQPLDLELDMEMPPPSGWEKRLDLKLGKFYFVNLSTGKSTYEHPSKQPSLSQQFLSIGKSSAAQRDKDSAARSWDLQSELDRIDMKDESQLDLKLNLGGCLPMPKSLSTIEAVQEALKRSQAAAAAAAATTTTAASTSPKQQQQQRLFLSPATSTSSSSSSKANSRSTDASESIIEKLSSSSSVAEVVDSKMRQAPARSAAAAAAAVAAAAADAKVVLTGCKRCLMYVMLTRANPRCPKCGSSVVLDIPLQQQLPKRPRLELDL